MATRPHTALLRMAAAAVRRLSTSAAASPAARDKGQGKLLYLRLSALGNKPKGSVAKTMNQWLRKGRSVNGIELIGYVTKLQKYGRYAHALELMEWMDTMGVKMHYDDYGQRLRLISKVEGIAAAEKYFSRLSMPAKTLDTYESLLSCYCTEKMGDKAMSLFEKMKQLSYASTSFVYSNLMTLQMKLGQPHKVPPLLQQMMAEKVAPDMICYSLVLNSYVSSGDVEAVEQLVKVMKEQDAGMLKWAFYGTLASFYISAGLIEKAESALEMLEKTMEIHNQECYHFLITLYSKTGNLVEVKRVWNNLKATFPKLTNKSYFLALYSLDRVDDIDALKDCFEEWESNCLAYNVKLASLMMKAYLRRDMIRDAESVLEHSVLKLTTEPDFYMFQILIGYFLEKRRTDLALKYAEDAILKVKNGVWKPSKGTFHKFLRYVQDQNMEGAEAFLDGLEKLDFLKSDSHGILPSNPAAAEGKESLHQLLRRSRSSSRWQVKFGK